MNSSFFVYLLPSSIFIITSITVSQTSEMVTKIAREIGTRIVDGLITAMEMELEMENNLRNGHLKYGNVYASGNVSKDGISNGNIINNY